MNVKMKLRREKSQKCIFRKKKVVSPHAGFNGRKSLGTGVRARVMRTSIAPNTALRYWPVVLFQGWSLKDSPQAQE